MTRRTRKFIAAGCVTGMIAVSLFGFFVLSNPMKVGSYTFSIDSGSVEISQQDAIRLAKEALARHYGDECKWEVNWNQPDLKVGEPFLSSVGSHRSRRRLLFLEKRKKLARRVVMKISEDGISCEIFIPK